MFAPSRLGKISVNALQGVVLAFAVLLVTGILIMPANLAAQRTLPPDISIPDDELPDKASYPDPVDRKIRWLLQSDTRLANYFQAHPDSGIADDAMLYYGQMLGNHSEMQDKADEVFRLCIEKYPDRIYFHIPLLWRGDAFDEEFQLGKLYWKYVEDLPSYTSDMCRLELGLYDEIIERHPNGEWAEEDSKQVFQAYSHEFYRPFERAVLKKIESHLKEGDVESATEMKEKLKKIYPNSRSTFMAMWWIGTHLKKTGNLEEALEIFEEALTHNERLNQLLKDAGLKMAYSSWEAMSGECIENIRRIKSDMGSDRRDNSSTLPTEIGTNENGVHLPNGAQEPSREESSDQSPIETQWQLSTGHWIVIGVIALTAIVVAAVLLKKRK